MNLGAAWEDRIPVSNTTYYALLPFGKNDFFTPNYPVERLDVPFPRHQALVTTIGLEYQPGSVLSNSPIEKYPIGSKYPTLQFDYTKGWDGLLGSSVNFDKWLFCRKG